MSTRQESDYQRFVESCVPFCHCCSENRPCDGVLAGGMCDDIQDEDREERLEDEYDL